MSALGIVGALIAVTVGWKSYESFRHRRHLSRLPIRIHINGTRGKSSVTRLIVAALNEAGIRAIAKTTGTLPRLILPDGSEQPINRVSGANVSEQIGIVKTACEHNAQALVIECMALQPHLQWVCESKLVKATHGVITNARADHLDVMGPTEVDVAKALANMTPIGSKLFTAEDKYLGVFAHAAKDRGTQLLPVTPEEIASVSDTEMKNFSYSEHKANVALVLALCEDLGIDRQTALKGMWNVNRDPGALTLHEVNFFGRRIVFANAFAANDPDSTEQAWQSSIRDASDVDQRIALINCRADRPDRSWQLGEAWEKCNADTYLLTGTGRHIFTRAAMKNGLNPDKVVEADDCDLNQLFETIIELAGSSAVVVGMGNIGNHGLEIVQYFKNRSVLPTERTPQPAERTNRLPEKRNGHHTNYIPDELVLAATGHS